MGEGAQVQHASCVRALVSALVTPTDDHPPPKTLQRSQLQHRVDANQHSPTDEHHQQHTSNPKPPLPMVCHPPVSGLTLFCSALSFRSGLMRAAASLAQVDLGAPMFQSLCGCGYVGV
jgi:hypothetical protein